VSQTTNPPMNIIGKRVCPACASLCSESGPCPVCLLRGALSPSAFASRSSSGTRCSELDFEHYRVLRNENGTPCELGRGAMGVTYKALDINLHSIVALKVLSVTILGDQSACRRFVREARAAAQVRHENVASVFHLGKQAHAYFYAMEYVEGEPLNKLIRRAGRLQPVAALQVISLVAAGLEAIAKQGLVHRDIKPSNIVVSFDRGRILNAKIIDLGLAKSIVEDDAISSPGSFVGTPAYASPEQFAGIGADIRSDLYSLGVTLWEMLCGELPFRGSSLELGEQHQHAPLPAHKLSQVPEPITTLLRTLLEKDPCRRFQRPAQLEQAVAGTLASLDRWLATDHLGSDGMRVQADRSVQFWAKIKALPRVWLRAFIIGVIPLVIAWLLLPGRVGSLLGRRHHLLVERSIAVLPFENISPNKNDGYFADGVQDEILRDLVGVGQLKAVSRTSVMQYRGDYFDLRKVACALGVTNVLEGTVQRVGNRVRVSIALVDARNDKLIWTDSYDRELTDVFAVQNEIAQRVAAKLNARFGESSR
jgi:serine/threonine protein kinase